MEIRIYHQTIGGQLLAIYLDDHQLLYFSPLSISHYTARGGIPICFPQFAEMGQLPKHGLVRNLPWICTLADDYALRYELHIGPNDFTNWPHAAHIAIHYTWTATALSARWTILNRGEQAFTFTGGLHPYFYVGDLHLAKLAGLLGCKLNDRYDAARERIEEDLLTFNHQALECSFEGTPDLILHADKHRQLKLSCQGFTHWMVWNPGEQGAEALMDLPTADWQRFICIEPVILTPTELAPAAIFEGILNIKILQ